MNQNQKYVLYAVIAVIAIMFLYPPFVFHYPRNIVPAGYGWLFSPPTSETNFTSMVNIPMLLIQWLGVLVLGGIAFFVVKK